jgi:hypothetical protein
VPKLRFRLQVMPSRTVVTVWAPTGQTEFVDSTAPGTPQIGSEAARFDPGVVGSAREGIGWRRGSGVSRRRGRTTGLLPRPRSAATAASTCFHHWCSAAVAWSGGPSAARPPATSSRPAADRPQPARIERRGRGGFERVAVGCTNAISLQIAEIAGRGPSLCTPHSRDALPYMLRLGARPVSRAPIPWAPGQRRCGPARIAPVMLGRVWWTAPDGS